GLVERFLPADLLEAGRGAAQGAAQPVPVLVHVLEGHGLRADVAAAEGILGVAADRADASLGHFDRDAAHRFAQVAGTEMRAQPGRVAHAVPVWWPGSAGAIKALLTGGGPGPRIAADPPRDRRPP